MPKFITLKIKRGNFDKEPHWEDFKIPFEPNLTVLDALKKINENPVNVNNQSSKYLILDGDCSDESCGLCSMIINGRARLACKTLVDRLQKPIKVEPLSKFALIEDLKVNRSELYKIKDELKMNLGIDKNHIKNDKIKSLANCIMCGCCVEACPRCNEKTDFIGPAMLSQVLLYNQVSDSRDKAFRLSKLMENGGIAECINTRNCEKVCPKKIPISDSISLLNFDISIFAIKKLFRE